MTEQLHLLSNPGNCVNMTLFGNSFCRWKVRSYLIRVGPHSNNGYPHKERKRHGDTETKWRYTEKSL